ncbi:MAG: CoB--CoM heterodisulfide reductase iron-sulfur subunit B family protein [Anaerolineae bacterium]|nr:CoB--CoM heterodisulfide reductase iron-sulfur subunit B family protein [Anaerolineae bacterium]
MASYTFYPGCSLQKSARPYFDSLMAISSVLNLDIKEIPDWNCCGATEYIAVHHVAAYALAGRNLALAAQMANGDPASHTVMAACSLCYLNLAKTDSYMRDDPQLNAQVNEALAAGGLTYTPGTLRVRHLLDIIIKDIGLDLVKSKVVKPLKGLRIAPYFGCMIARPDRSNRWDNVEHPVALDRLMRALGAEVVDYPMKTHCCGGHMTQINTPVAYELIRRLVHGAAEYNADLMVTLCPMCQLNLDAYQTEMNRYFHTNYRMPILYFTQLMGVAFGLEPETLGLGKEFVDSRPALGRIGVELPPPEAELAAVTPKPRPKKAEKGAKVGLPMPQMPGDEEVSE